MAWFISNPTLIWWLWQPKIFLSTDLSVSDKGNQQMGIISHLFHSFSSLVFLKSKKDSLFLVSILFQEENTYLSFPITWLFMLVRLFLPQTFHFLIFVSHNHFSFSSFHQIPPTQSPINQPTFSKQLTRHIFCLQIQIPEFRFYSISSNTSNLVEEFPTLLSLFSKRYSCQSECYKSNTFKKEKETFSPRKTKSWVHQYRFLFIFASFLCFPCLLPTQHNQIELSQFNIICIIWALKTEIVSFSILIFFQAFQRILHLFFSN